MNTVVKNIVFAALIGWFIGTVFTLIAENKQEQDRAMEQRFDECLDFAHKHIDPNELEERSNFIRECFENPHA